MAPIIASKVFASIDSLCSPPDKASPSPKTICSLTFNCFANVDSTKVERIAHICCGYPDKLDAVNYPKAPLDSYKKIANALDASLIDSVSLEDAHRYNDLELLRNFTKTKVIFGLIKIASSQKETEEEIENRVLDALNYIDKQQLIAAPDCGLGHLPRQLAIEKLKIMVDVAKKF